MSFYKEWINWFGIRTPKVVWNPCSPNIFVLYLEGKELSIPPVDLIPVPVRPDGVNHIHLDGKIKRLC